MLRTDAQFWLDLDELVATSEVLVDRPAGQPHPDFPELIYPGEDEEGDQAAGAHVYEY